MIPYRMAHTLTDLPSAVRLLSPAAARACCCPALLLLHCCCTAAAAAQSWLELARVQENTACQQVSQPLK